MYRKQLNKRSMPEQNNRPTTRINGWEVFGWIFLSAATLVALVLAGIAYDHSRSTHSTSKVSTEKISSNINVKQRNLIESIQKAQKEMLIKYDSMKSRADKDRLDTKTSIIESRRQGSVLNPISETKFDAQQFDTNGLISLKDFPGVQAGTYPSANVTVNSKGLVIGIESGTCVRHISTGTGIEGGPIRDVGCISLEKTGIEPGEYGRVIIDEYGRVVEALPVLQTITLHTNEPKSSFGETFKDIPQVSAFSSYLGSTFSRNIDNITQNEISLKQDVARQQVLHLTKSILADAQVSDKNRLHLLLVNEKGELIVLQEIIPGSRQFSTPIQIASEVDKACFVHPFTDELMGISYSSGSEIFYRKKLDSTGFSFSQPEVICTVDSHNVNSISTYFDNGKSFLTVSTENRIYEMLVFDLLQYEGRHWLIYEIPFDEEVKIGSYVKYKSSHIMTRTEPEHKLMFGDRVIHSWCGNERCPIYSVSYEGDNISVAWVNPDHGGVEMFVSTDSGLNWSKDPVLVSHDGCNVEVKSLSDNRLIVVYSRDGSVFLKSGFYGSDFQNLDEVAVSANIPSSGGSIKVIVTQGIAEILFSVSNDNINGIFAFGESVPTVITATGYM